LLAAQVTACLPIENRAVYGGEEIPGGRIDKYGGKLVSAMVTIWVLPSRYFKVNMYWQINTLVGFINVNE